MLKWNYPACLSVQSCFRITTEQHFLTCGDAEICNYMSKRHITNTCGNFSRTNPNEHQGCEYKQKLHLDPRVWTLAAALSAFTLNANLCGAVLSLSLFISISLSFLSHFHFFCLALLPVVCVLFVCFHGCSCYQWGGERLVCSWLCPSCPTSFYPFLLFHLSWAFFMSLTNVHRFKVVKCSQSRATVNECFPEF